MLMVLEVLVLFQATDKKVVQAEAYVTGLWLNPPYLFLLVLFCSPESFR